MNQLNVRPGKYRKRYLIKEEINQAFVDVEGMKVERRLINLLAITVNLYHEIDADPSGSGSKPIGSGNNRC